MPKRDYYHISLKLILKNDKDEVLVLGSDPKGSLLGMYDLPGGRIDESEFGIPYEQIIRREVAEEIGDIELTINVKPVGIGRHLIPKNMTSKNKEIHIMYIFFEARMISGKIKISSEHSGYKWVKLEEHDPAKLFTSGILEGINMYLNKY
ncbi:MAG: NUDIX domain-containing protein [Patescibacteria group bacterium]|jgi:8-oxo-dGTP pyrophosphatase MutT (NUDIX family)